MRLDLPAARLLVLGLALAAPALADVLVLASGERIEGGVVGRDDGALVVLTAKGERRLDPATVAAVESSSLPSMLERKVERARMRLADAHQRDASKQIHRWLRADATERTAILAALDALGPAATAAALEDVLDDGSPGLRDFALERLAALGPAGQDPLLRYAVLARDDAARERAHAAALGIDATRTRQVYEQVATMETRPIRRVRAIQHLGDLGQRESAPALIAVLEYVQQEIKVQMATAGGIRTVPLNLGTQSGAAVNAPVDLPQMQLVEIATTVTVPVLRVMSAEAARALHKLSGEDHGDDPAAWRRWMDAHPRAPGQ